MNGQNNKRKGPELDIPGASGDVTKKLKIDMPSSTNSNFSYNSLKNPLGAQSSSSSSSFSNPLLRNMTTPGLNQLNPLSRQNPLAAPTQSTGFSNSLSSSSASFLTANKQQFSSSQFSTSQAGVPSSNSSSQSSSERLLTLKAGIKPSSSLSTSRPGGSGSSMSQSSKFSPSVSLNKEAEEVKKMQLQAKQITKEVEKMNAPDQYKGMIAEQLLSAQRKIQQIKKRDVQLNKLIQDGTIKREDIEKNKKIDAPIEFDDQELRAKVNEQGQLVDQSGSIIQIDETQKQSLIINKSQKQQEIYRKMKKQAQQQSTQQSLLYDSLLPISKNQKEKRKALALNFIEQGSIVKKAESLRNQIEDFQSSERKEAASAQIEGETPQGTEGDNTKQQKEDLKAKNFLSDHLSKMLNLSVAQTGLKRISIARQHHDPIPNVEWWDLPLLAVGNKQQQKSYFGNLIRQLKEEKEAPKMQMEIEKQKIVVQEPEAQNIVTEEGKEEPTNQEAENESEIKTTSENVNPHYEKIFKTNIISEQKAKLEKLIEDMQELPFNSAPIDYIFQSSLINNLIEHPAPFKNNISIILNNSSVTVPTFLTQEQRQKLRRKRRKEKELEKQDKIKLGLIQPPPPKLKLQNMMKTHTYEAVMDPSKIEAEIKKNISERQAEHLKRNEQRQKTKEQKAEQSMLLIKRDSAVQCRVAIFRIEDLRDKVMRFKIDKNAQQLQLHGLCIYPYDSSGTHIPAMVVVEGGPKAIKFYQQLMMNRIKWNSPTHFKPQNEEDANKFAANQCSMVWQGVVKDRNFNQWRTLEINSEVQANKALDQRGVAYYWDMVISHKDGD